MEISEVPSLISEQGGSTDCTELLIEPLESVNPEQYPSDMLSINHK